MTKDEDSTVPGEKHWDPALYDARHSFVWRYGLEVVESLSPQPGERVLDLGCGTGHLTNKIAESGASVIGIDKSPSMIEQAGANYPDLRFEIADGLDFRFDEPFDAVFSNAAIHWMPDPAKVASCVFRALKPGGRFVAELGGKGNLFALHGAIYTALEKAGCEPPGGAGFRYYPTIGEYASVLEAAGFVVASAFYFDRPTPLSGGEQGLRHWLEVFANNMLGGVPRDKLDAVFGDIEDRLRSELYHDDSWYADYRRLRVRAIRPG